MAQNAPQSPSEPTSSLAKRRRSARRLRPHRLRAGDLGLTAITAVARHPTGELLHGTVADLSIHGLGLIIPSTAQLGSLVLAGDRLTTVTVSAGSRVIHEGAAVVRRVSEHPRFLSVGLELEAPGLDLSEVYREGARRGLTERWTRVHRAARHADINPSFKTWVASLRAYLESVRAFLNREEELLGGEDQATRRSLEAELLDLVAPDVITEISSATSELATLVRDLSDEEHALYRAFCLLHLGSFFRCSPFMRRAHEKPLGYAGDYEMMNMLYRDHAEGQTLFGKVLNLYATSEAAARANINRIEYLSRMIEQAAERAVGTERVRVASIGSGPGQEIRHLLTRRPDLGRRLNIALIDQEERAVAHCERVLSPIARATGAFLSVIPESVRRLLVGGGLSERLGQRDLVYSAGLCDYLSTRTFGALLTTLYDALGRGGSLVAGNVAADNPSRWAMEYFSEWFLIHRSRAELASLARNLAPTPTSVRVESEELGVNLFLIVER